MPTTLHPWHIGCIFCRQYTGPLLGQQGNAADSGGTQISAPTRAVAFVLEMPMSRLISSLRSGNWKALLACFLYFDTGFTTWVMFGPLAPFISKQISLTPIQAGF